MKPPSANEAFLGPDLTSGPTFNKSGYNFSLAGTGLPGAPATCNGLGAGVASPGYAVVADALDPQNTRFFGTNADGVLYEHTLSLARSMPESGPPPAGAPINNYSRGASPRRTPRRSLRLRRADQTGSRRSARAAPTARRSRFAAKAGRTPTSTPARRSRASGTPVAVPPPPEATARARRSAFGA